MQRMGLLWMLTVLLASCAHYPVPADCKTHLERINPMEDAQKKGDTP